MTYSLFEYYYHDGNLVEYWIVGSSLSTFFMVLGQNRQPYCHSKAYILTNNIAYSTATILISK